jgi:hypothetical protein
MKRIIPTIFMLLLMFGVVHADDFQDGIDAYEREDYKTAFSKILIGQPNSPIPILNSSFYVGTRNAIDDEFVWTKSNFVPSTPDNACYKWAIMLDTELSSISTREVFILPSKPKSWGYKEGMTLYKDSRVSVTEKVLEVDNGVINNGWCVTEGDPTGDYKIEVYVNEVLAESFNFTVGLKL